MKHITSPKIGSINYEAQDIIKFPNGLFGFEEYREFLLIKNEGNDIFLFLQSITEPGLTFILIDPKSVMKEYELRVDEETLNDLDSNHVWDFAIVTIPEDPKEMVMNLMGPILIDIKNQIGKQIISSHPEYSTRHKIFNEIDQKLAI